MMSCPEAMGWGFWNLKKIVSWDLGLDEASQLSEPAEARPVVCGGVPHVVGSDGKVSIERNCGLSLLMSKNLKLKKVNKSFVPEPISCFFGFLWICVRTLWTFYACEYLGRIFWREYITMTLNCIWWWGIRSVSLGKVDNPFIAIIS